MRKQPKLGVSFNLDFLKVLLENRHQRVIEIGSWRGYSASVILGQIAKFPDSHLFCVDHWQGSPSTEQPTEIAQRGLNIYAEFLDNMFALEYETRVTPIKLPSLEAAKLFPDNYASLIFIDGDHAYTPTKKDIEVWWPKVRDGGVLCGHDFECFYHELPKGLHNKDNWEKDCIQGYHIGVIKAVSEIFPNADRRANIWAVTKQPTKKEKG